MARNVCRMTTLVAGALIFASGLTHTFLGVPHLQRSVAAGEIDAEVAPGQFVGWVFGGTAMNVLGILVLMVAPEVSRGSRRARQKALVIGLFYVLFGAGASIYRFPIPQFIGFIVIGALLSVPLLLSGREFDSD